jgi:hypothetical protein
MIIGIQTLHVWLSSPRRTAALKHDHRNPDVARLAIFASPHCGDEMNA